MNVDLITGDARTMLATLPDKSIQCCVTSPPYFGLRDYGTVTFTGGDPNCDHVVGAIRTGLGMAALGERYSGGGHKTSEPKLLTAKDICPKCQAVRVDQQIGIEASPDAFIAALVAVFRDVRRVLRDDGTVWIVLGDSYASSPRGNKKPGGGNLTNINIGSAVEQARWEGARKGIDKSRIAGVKPKDLLMVPARAAIALQADGWYLRRDIIWAKPNPMPESTLDRPTSSHEHVFLLTKKPTYFYDAEAVREPDAGTDHPRNGWSSVD